MALSQQSRPVAYPETVPYREATLKKYIMDKYSKDNTILNAILSVVNISLEIILGLIALGFLIGLWGIIS